MHPFDEFTCDLAGVQEAATEDAWVVHLRCQGEVRTRPGEHAAAMFGDPWDAAPLTPTTMRWGIPNQWMAEKGLDPWASTTLFIDIREAFSRETHKLYPSLVAVTRLGPPGGGAPTKLQLLPVVHCSASADDHRSGFAFLTEEGELQMLRQGCLPKWMCGWTMPTERRGLVETAKLA